MNMIVANLFKPVSMGLLRQPRQLSRIPACWMQTQPKIAFVQGQQINKEFWSKNEELKRPMSPHLTIYKFELPANLSILHRITGLGASVALYGAGIGAIFCNQSFPEILQVVQSIVPHSLILVTKTALGGAIIYHTLNGVRHLVWDAGYGFKLKHLYMSGYAVVALTALGTVMVFLRG